MNEELSIIKLLQTSEFLEIGGISVKKSTPQSITLSVSFSDPVTWENFSWRTRAIFEPCKVPNRPPDFISKSGSKYWKVGIYVIMQSSHWGRVADCYWQTPESANAGEWTGKCAFAQFERIPAKIVLTKSSVKFLKRLYSFNSIEEMINYAQSNFSFEVGWPRLSVCEIRGILGLILGSGTLRTYKFLRDSGRKNNH